MDKMNTIMQMFLAGMLLITVWVLGACSSEDTATVPVPGKRESAKVDKRSTAMNGYEEVAQILREAEMEASQQK